MTATIPLEITSVHDGQTATRWMFNDRAHVVLSSLGHMVCCARACIADGTFADCQHVQFVRDVGIPQMVQEREAV